MKKQAQFYIVAFVILSLSNLACSLLQQVTAHATVTNSKPIITISSPVSGAQLSPGSEIKVQSTSIDPDGIARVELFVNGELERVDTNASITKNNAPYIVAQPWLPRKTGFYVIQVRSYDTIDTMGESAALTVEMIEVAPNTATPTPTNTSTPTATPSPLPPPPPTPTAVSSIPTLTKTPKPTKTPTPIVLNLPSPTTTPTVGVFSDTGLRPVGRFEEIWEIVPGGKERLGYPTKAEISDRNFAKQRFERGQMYWWDSADGPHVWAIDSYAANDVNRGTTWNLYTESWPSEEVEFYNCIEALANGTKGPVRGLGKLWCVHPELQVRLGNPVEFEVGSAGNPPFLRVQFFQGGLMIYDPSSSELWVLFNQGDWQRFKF